MITINGFLPTVQSFPNGETNLVLSDLSWSSSAPNEIVWTYEGDYEFMQLAQLVDLLKRHGATTPTVSIPYFPYERMDRVDPDVHNSLTLEVALNMLPKGLHYFIIEPHSHVLQETADKDYTWCQEFITELMEWDGTYGRNSKMLPRWCNTNYSDVKAVSRIATLAGYGAYISKYKDNRNDAFNDVYTVNIMVDNKLGGGSRKIDKLVGSHPTLKISVPHHRIIIQNSNGNGSMVVNDTDFNISSSSEMLIKTLESLWDTFGGTVNAKGYKVLDPHVGLLHGEGVTLDNVEDYFDAILDAGFSAENIIFGLGAYVYSVLSTRDSFGQAVKATSVTINGVEKAVYKDPKTKTESFKKSLRGRVLVTKEKGEYKVEDNFDVKTLNAHLDKQELHTIFEGGISIAPVDFKGIRQTILDDI